MKNFTVEQQRIINSFRHNLFGEKVHFENVLRQSPEVNFLCTLVDNFNGLRNAVDEVINKEFLPTISSLIYKNEFGYFDDILIEYIEQDYLQIKIRIRNPANFKPLN